MSDDLVVRVLQHLQDARRTKKDDIKDLCTVILGEVDTRKARTGEDPSNEEIEKFIRKMVEDNEKTIALIKNDKGRASNSTKLKKENDFLKTLLPTTLTLSEIELHLDEVLPEILDAPKDGLANGIAMKHLKKLGIKNALGKDVASVVSSLRK